MGDRRCEHLRELKGSWTCKAADVDFFGSKTYGTHICLDFKQQNHTNENRHALLKLHSSDLPLLLDNVQQAHWWITLSVGLVGLEAFGSFLMKSAQCVV